jgi:hypothetical protein
MKEFAYSLNVLGVFPVIRLHPLWCGIPIIEPDMNVNGQFFVFDSPL